MDRQTDRQNYDSQDRAIIAALCGKNGILKYQEYSVVYSLAFSTQLQARKCQEMA